MGHFPQKSPKINGSFAENVYGGSGFQKSALQGWHVVN